MRHAKLRSWGNLFVGMLLGVGVTTVSFGWWDDVFFGESVEETFPLFNSVHSDEHEESNQMRDNFWWLNSSENSSENSQNVTHSGDTSSSSEDGRPAIPAEDLAILRQGGVVATSVPFFEPEPAAEPSEGAAENDEGVVNQATVEDGSKGNATNYEPLCKRRRMSTRSSETDKEKFNKQVDACFRYLY